MAGTWGEAVTATLDRGWDSHALRVGTAPARLPLIAAVGDGRVSRGIDECEIAGKESTLMARGNRSFDRKLNRLAPLVALATVAASLFAFTATAGAGTIGSVSVLSGSAFGEHVDINAGGGHIVSGPIPTVTLPAAGGNVSASLPSIFVPPAGPTGIFVTSTGPLTAHSEGAIGSGGSATSTASLSGVSTLGGTFTAPSVASSCVSNANGSTGSTTLGANSMLIVTPQQTVTLPTSPAANLTFQGTGSNGDTFTVIFNEQTSTSGGGNTGITVNAVHLILHGPQATGNITLAQSHCDSTVGTVPTTCKRVTGTVTGPVVVGSGKNICYVNATITGGLSVKSGGQVSITNSTVFGGITSNGALAFTLCGSNLPASAADPNLSVTNSTGPVRIGDPATNCLGNSIGGNAVVNNNTAGVIFGNNFVAGSATFKGNTGGSTVIKNNFIGSALGCTTNSPAPGNAGQPNTAASKTGQCVGV